MGRLEFLEGAGLGPRPEPVVGMAEVYDQVNRRWVVVPEEDAWQYSTDAMQYSTQYSTQSMTSEEGES